MNPWDNDPDVVAGTPWDNDPDVTDTAQAAPWDNDPDVVQSVDTRDADTRYFDWRKNRVDQVSELTISTGQMQPGLQLAQEPLPALQPPDIQTPPANINAADAAGMVADLYRLERDAQQAEGAGIQPANEAANLQRRNLQMAGLSPEDINRRLEDFKALDFSASTRGMPRARTLSDGRLVVDPALAFDPAAWNAAVDGSSASDVEKENAKYYRTQLREELAQQIVSPLRSASPEFAAALEKGRATRSVGELVEDFKRTNSGTFSNLWDQFGIALSQGKAQLGKSLMGAARMATFDMLPGNLGEGFADDAQWHAQRRAALGGGQWAGDLTATVVGTLPSVAVGAGTSSFPAMLATAGGQTAGDTFVSARQAGWSPLEAAGAALVQGGVEVGVTAAFGRTGIESVAAGASEKGLVRRVITEGAAEIPEEVSITALQSPMNEVIQPGSSADLPQQLLDTAWQSAVIGGGVAALNGKPAEKPAQPAAATDTTAPAPAQEAPNFDDLAADLKAIANEESDEPTGSAPLPKEPTIWKPAPEAPPLPPAPVAPDENFARATSFPRGLLPFVTPEEAGAVMAEKEGQMQLVAVQALMNRARTRQAEAATTAPQPATPDAPLPPAPAEPAPIGPDVQAQIAADPEVQTDVTMESASPQTATPFAERQQDPVAEGALHVRETELLRRLESKRRETRENAEAELMARKGLPWTNKPEQAEITARETAALRARVQEREARWNNEAERLAEEAGIEITADNIPFSQQKINPDPIAQAVKETMEMLGVGPDVVTAEVVDDVESIEDINARRAAMASKKAGNNIRAYYLAGKNGKPSRVVINAAGVRTPEQARIATLHEVAGHHGLRVLFRKAQGKWRGIVDRLYRRLSNGELSQDVQRETGVRTLRELQELYHRPDAGMNYDPATEEGRSNLIEEVLTTMAPFAKKPAWYQSILSELKTLLNRVTGGLLGRSFTDADVNVLLAKARRAAKQGIAGGGAIKMSQQDAAQFRAAETTVTEEMNKLARNMPANITESRAMLGYEAGQGGGGWNRQRNMSNNAAAAIDAGKIMEDDLPSWIADTLGIPRRAITQKAVRMANIVAQNIYPEYHHVGNRTVNFYDPAVLSQQAKFWLGLAAEMNVKSHKSAARNQAMKAWISLKESITQRGELGQWSSAKERTERNAVFDTLSPQAQSEIRAGKDYQTAIREDFERLVSTHKATIYRDENISKGLLKQQARNEAELAEAIAKHPYKATGATEAAPALDSRQSPERSESPAPTRAEDARIANRATEATSATIRGENATSAADVNIRFSQESAEREARSVQRALEARAEDLKEYATQKKAKADPNVPDAVKQMLNGVYATYSDAQALRDAQAWLDKDGADEVERTLMGGQRAQLDGRDVAAAKLIASRLSTLGLHQRYTDFMRAVFTKMNTQAQGLQKMHLLFDTTTPEGALAYFQKEVENAISQLSDKNKEQARIIQGLLGMLEQFKADAATSRIVMALRTIAASAELTEARKAEVSEKMRAALVNDDGTDTTRVRLRGLFIAAGVEVKAADKMAVQLLTKFRAAQKKARAQVIKKLLKVPKIEKRIPKGMFAKWEKLNDEGALSDAKLFGAIANKFGFPVFTSEDAATIRGFFDRYKAATEPELKLLEADELLTWIHTRTEPAGLLEKYGTFFTLAKLVSFKVFERNLIGNVVMALTRSAGIDVPMWVGRKALSAFTGGRVAPLQTAIGNMFRGQAEVNRIYRVGRDFSIAQGGGKIESMRYGLRTLLAASRAHLSGVRDAQGLRTAHRTVFTSAAGRMFERGMHALLTLPDLGRFYGEVNARLAYLMKMAGPGVVVPTAEMFEDAYGHAMREIYQDKNALTEAANDLVNALNLKKKFGLGTVIMPFRTVPVNMLKEGLTFSPLGVIRAFYNWKVQDNPQRAFESLLKVASGTGAIAPMGAWLYYLGIITAAWDEDDKVREVQRSMGFQAYAINWSMFKRRWTTGNWHTKEERLPTDMLHSYGWAQPVAFMLAAGAERQRREELGISVPKYWWEKYGTQPIGSGIAGFLEQPLVTGLVAFAQDLSRATREKNYEHLARIPLRALDIMPSALRDVRYSMNNTVPETRDSDVIRGELSRIFGGIPFVDMPQRYNVMGQAEERYQGVTNSILNVFFNPVTTTMVKNDPVGAEVLRLAAATGDASVAPGRVDKKIQINTTGISGESKTLELTNKDISELQRIQSQIWYKLVEIQTHNPIYHALPPVEQARSMKNAISASQNAAKAYLFGHQLQTMGRTGMNVDRDAYWAISVGRAAGIIP